MENKRKNIYIVLFVITTIIACCVAVYFAIQPNRKVGENGILKDGVENIATDEVNKTQTNVEIKEVEKEVKLPIIDLENTDADIRQEIENLKVNFDLYLPGFDLKSDIYGENPKLIFYDENTSSNKEINVLGINKKIIDAKMGCPDYQGAEWYIYFLLEDGSVAILKDLSNLTQKNDIYIAKTVVKDIKIVRLVSFGASRHIYGIDEDGKIFDLT